MSLLNTLIATTLPFIPKAIVGKVSRRYIAGITLDDALRQVTQVNAKRMMATLDLLGEDVHDRSVASSMKDSCIRMFREIQKSRHDSNVSIKLSQLGLRIDKELCFANVKEIVAAARTLGNFVRIDMEDSSTADDTLEIYRRLRAEGFENVGVVIQAYLKRSKSDVQSLVKEKANFRICKGIYLEAPEIAFQDREEIR